MYYTPANGGIQDPRNANVPGAAVGANGANAPHEYAAAAAAAGVNPMPSYMFPPGRYYHPSMAPPSQWYPQTYFPIDPTHHQQWIQHPSYGNMPPIPNRQPDVDSAESEGTQDDERSNAGYVPPAVPVMQQNPPYFQIMPQYPNMYMGPSGMNMHGYSMMPYPYPAAAQAMQQHNMAANVSVVTDASVGHQGSSVANGSRRPANGVGGATAKSKQNNASATDKESSFSPTPVSERAEMSPPPMSNVPQPQHPPHPSMIPMGQPPTMQYGYPYYPGAPGIPPHHLTNVQNATGSPLFIPPISVFPNIYGATQAPQHPQQTQPQSMYEDATDTEPSETTNGDEEEGTASPVTDATTTTPTATATTISTVTEERVKNSTLLVDSEPFEPASSKLMKELITSDPAVISISASPEVTEPIVDLPITITSTTITETLTTDSLSEAETPVVTDTSVKVTASDTSTASIIENIATNHIVSERGIETNNNVISETKVNEAAERVAQLRLPHGNERRSEERKSAQKKTASERKALNDSIKSTEKAKSADLPQSVTAQKPKKERKSSMTKAVEPLVNGECLKNVPSSSTVVEKTKTPTSSNTNSRRSQSKAERARTEVNPEKVAEVNTPPTPIDTTPATEPVTRTWAGLFTQPSRPKPKVPMPPPSKTAPSVVDSEVPIDQVTRSNVYNEQPKLFPPVRGGQRASSGLPVTSPLDDQQLSEFAELLKKYKLDHRTVSFRPRGLVNRSTFCYVNVILQSLIGCPPFFNFMKFLSVNIERFQLRQISHRCFPIMASIVKFSNEFSMVQSKDVNPRRSEKLNRDTAKSVSSLETQKGDPFEPTYMYQMLNALQQNGTFVMGQQEDAHEFLTCFLNSMNDELSEIRQIVDKFTKNGVTNEKTSDQQVVSNGDIAEGEDSEDPHSEWREMQRKNKSAIVHRRNLTPTPVSEIFGGQMRHRLQKSNDPSANNVEPFFTLDLNIERANTVAQALEQFLERDSLEGVTSSRTNQEVNAWQQHLFEELPLVLVLHLNFYKYKNNVCSKINKMVEYSVDLFIDMKMMWPQSTRSYQTPTTRRYKLFAAVYHDGRDTSKGHYVADVFHIGVGGWLRYDDANIKVVSESEVLRPQLPRVPYLLYYRRNDTIGALNLPPRP